MNIRLFRIWGIGILAAAGMAGCATLAPRDAGRLAPGEAPAISAFVSPLPGSRIISPFGPRRRRMHEGVDLLKSARGGDAVTAARDGIVETARRCRGYGLTVMVLHSDGSRTRYAHLRKLLVREHQDVAAGQQLGIVGATGNATRPHLHFEILTALNRFVDPAPYLQQVLAADGRPGHTRSKAVRKPGPDLYN
jgi:murein DD-endopeptidase MepM/ murein hydrolase activator NlpD